MRNNQLTQMSSNGVSSPDSKDLLAFAELLNKYPKLYELMKPPDERDRRTVQDVIETYLKRAELELAPRTFQHVRLTLVEFADCFGSRRVMDCIPLDLQQWVDGHRGWASDWTKMRVCATVKRAFNWAVNMRFIRENPFTGIHYSPGPPGRNMTDEEFQACLCHSPPHFRRFLLALKWTGARPSELRALKWSHIDWKRNVAILPEHKTAKKTRKPRTLVLIEPMMKLLKWLRVHNRNAAAETLHRILANGPRKAREVSRLMQAEGFSYRQLYRARIRLGARYRRDDEHTARGTTVWESARRSARKGESRTAKKLREILAAGSAPAKEVIRQMKAAGFSTAEVYDAFRDIGATRRQKGPFGQKRARMVYELPRQSGTNEPPPQEFVFLSAYGRPWTRSGLLTRWTRLRRRAKLPMDCRQYGTRHMFGTRGVKAGLNLITLAALMGHASVTTTQIYCHINGDIEHLLDAATEIAKLKSN